MDGRRRRARTTDSPELGGGGAVRDRGTDLSISVEDAQSAANDILAAILDREPGLSKSHRKIAQAILGYPRVFVEKPIEELVPWIGVSAPTITRFSREVGCDGLRDLKLKIMGSMRVGLQYLEPQTPPATLIEVGERVAMRAQRAIVNAQKTLDLGALEQAIEIISRSRMIYAFGSGGVSSWLIEEVHNRLFRLGLHVSTSADHQMQMMLAATVGRGDVIFCSSLSGTNPELMRALRIGADYGAQTIGLTVAGTPLADMVDISLAVNVADDGDVLGPTSVRYAFLAVIDMLAYGAAVRSRPAALEKLRRIKQQFTMHRDSDTSKPLAD
ncbi:MurR/RpiR family transcriptional regulator [Kaistia defluvii]|uniref:MurR/RpiR family transcriptional regulator n=1 Tax=Kaistia defluvii TaxID=410841 RepID=UPI0022590766|nr:MurR/RpiR family transcriptional regulator [Kaistia defluvii]MCX5518275.1 MurR/RpiR family transcriptional regulator [Kaistia defluvii]